MTLGSPPVTRSLILGQPECLLAEQAVALNGGVVALEGPLGLHAAWTIGILERVVELEERHVLLARDLGDELVQPADVRLGLGPAVVPRQDVRERDAQPERFA